MKFAIYAIVILFVARSHAAEDIYNQGTRAVLRVYDECNKSEYGLTACLKKKAITFIDRVGRLDSLTFTEGFKVVKNANAAELKTISDNELEQTLPRGLEAREEVLTNMLVEKVANFVSGRTLQVELPKMNTEEIGRSIEEGENEWKEKREHAIARKSDTLNVTMFLFFVVVLCLCCFYFFCDKLFIFYSFSLYLSSLLCLICIE